jgi:hypothetical protein
MDERESGFTLLAFEQAFNASFVKLYLAGHALAQANAAAIRGFMTLAAAEE